MSTTTLTKTESANRADATALPRILQEGYGPGAWHGADLKAALADVAADLAFWRPQAGRHNIAEIALHHAYCARGVRGRLTGATPEPFAVEGDDWFPMDGPSTMGWDQIRDVLDTEQQRLAAAVGDMAAGRLSSTMADAERLELVLGITCHAVYHAGQVQLLKVLRGS